MSLETVEGAGEISGVLNSGRTSNGTLRGRPRRFGVGVTVGVTTPTVNTGDAPMWMV